VPNLSLDSRPGSKNSKNMTLPGNIANEWEAVTIANAIEFDENKKKEKLKVKAAQADNRRHLDALTRQHEEKAGREREEVMRGRREDRARHEEWVEEEEARKEKKQREHKELRKM